MGQDGLLRKLKEHLDNGQVVVVVGTGVSIETSDNAPCARWDGLIADGIEYALDNDLIDELDAASLRTDLATNNFAQWPDVAQRVSEALQVPGGDFRLWLQLSIGRLLQKNFALLEAIHALGAPLATTNYDDLLKMGSGYSAIPWTEDEKVEEWMRGDRKQSILHLHGYFDDPHSVVLGVGSYEHLLRNEIAQFVQRALIRTRILLFIGCGDGLYDPNFGALLDWVSATSPRTPYRHFCLCRTVDKPALQKRCPSNRPVAYITYGDDFGDLAKFIRTNLLPRSRRRLEAAANLPVLGRCVGREQEVEEVVAALMAEPPERLPILGPPGSGKSTVAAHALHDSRVAARFGARRWFLRCDDAESRSALVNRLAAALEITPEEAPEDAVLDALARRPGTLVLDNLETPWREDGEAVEELLGKLAMIESLALVVTIRAAAHPHGFAWASTIDMTPLNPAQAKEVFLAESGKKAFREDPHLDRLIGALDGLPLAIVLMARYAQSYGSLEPVWHAWEKKRTRILEKIALSFELSIRPLSRSAKRLLSVVAMLPNGIAQTDVSAVFAGGDASAHELRKAALVFDDEAGRVRMLSPIREYLRDEGRHPPRRDALRAIRHYVTLAAAETAKIGGWAGADAVRRLTPEITTIETVLALDLTPLDERLTEAALGWTALIRFTGLGTPSAVEHVVARALSAGMHEEAARCIHRLGDIAVARTDFVTAHARYEEARRLFAQTGSDRGIAACKQGFGSIALRQGHFALGRKHYEDALAVFRHLRDKPWVAICIQSLGNAFHRLFDYPEAERRYRAAHKLFVKIGSPGGQASCLKSLGNLSLESNLARAAELFDDARKLYDAVPNVRGQAKCIKGFGHIARLRGDYPAARAAYEEALPLYRQVGSILGQAICIHGLAETEYQQGNYPLARPLFQEAGDLYSKLEDRRDRFEKCKAMVIEIERLAPGELREESAPRAAVGEDV